MRYLRPDPQSAIRNPQFFEVRDPRFRNSTEVPLCPIAIAAVDEIKRRGERAWVAPQNLIEFWSVATRPGDANGLGSSPERASEEIDRIEKMFRVLPDLASCYGRWRTVVRTYGVRGRQVHDARLVAQMLEHGVAHVLTFNVGDSTRYSEVVTVSPHELAPPPRATD